MLPISFQNVSHRYDSADILKNITADIPANAITAVIGRSGSGKSTLLKCVNGMVHPTAGHVRVFDAPMNYGDLPQLRRKIGYAVQGTGLFPHMTVRENIALLGRVTKMSSKNMTARVEHLMRLVSLDEFYINKYPHDLSGGEQQRVGLCRAMLLNPPIFLLDEPFGALDPATRSEIHTELLKLQAAEPRTIFFVTHDMQEALSLADNIMVLDHGEMIQFGAKSELLSNPASDLVRSYIKQDGLHE